MTELNTEVVQVREHLEQEAARLSLEYASGKVFEPPRMLIYGANGAGKSTFAAGAPNSIFFDLERGVQQIGPARLPTPSTLAEFERQLRSIRDLNHDRQTIVVDTIDVLEALVHAAICRETGASSIAAACGGYGKGLSAAETTLQRLLAAFDELRLVRGMAIVLLAHGKIEKYESPEHPTYDRHSPNLHRGAAGLVTAWCDVVGFVTRRIHVEERDEGFSRVRALAKPVHSRNGDRIIRFGGGPAFVAKSRYAIPAEMPLDWPTFQAALATAMR